MFGFAREEGLGDEEGEVGVDVAGVFEAAIEVALDAFPDGEAFGADDHAGAMANLGNQMVASGRLSTALRVHSRARVVAPGEPGYLMALGATLTQAGRTGARTVVIVRGEQATVRREGNEQTVGLGEVVATLTGQ